MEFEDAICLLTEANAWDVEAKEFWFPSGIQTSLTFPVGTTTSQNKRVSKCRSFQKRWNEVVGAMPAGVDGEREYPPKKNTRHLPHAQPTIQETLQHCQSEGSQVQFGG